MILYGLLGLLLGQVVVWLADRLPMGRPLHEVSLCPACGRAALAHRPGPAWLIAVGWRSCGLQRSRWRWRSFAAMLITAAGFAFFWSRYPLARDLIPLSVYWAIFVLITLIDLEHRLILNVVVLPAIVLAIGGSFLTTGPGIWRALLGGLTGFVLVYGIYLLGIVFARVMSRRRGQPIREVAFGAGDVKFAAFIGLVTGLPGIVFALVIGILSGGIAAGACLLWGALVRRRYVAFTAIPYGPFLALGGVIMMVYGPQIVAWYVQPYM